MLSEKEIEALKNGAYGVTRDGRKVKYLGENVAGGHFWLECLEDNKVKVISYDHFDDYYIKRDQSCYDIVGLWENKSEPFNLAGALAGAPVKIIDKPHVKSWVTQCRSNPTLYVVETDAECTNGVHINVYDCDGLKKNCVMWEEPVQGEKKNEPLPNPIRSFGGLNKVWYIHATDANVTVNYILKGGGWTNEHKAAINKGVFYESYDDCKKVCDWLMGR